MRWDRPRPLSARGFLSVVGESMAGPPPEALKAAQVPCLHFYTMGRSEAVRALREVLASPAWRQAASSRAGYAGTPAAARITRISWVA